MFELWAWFGSPHSFCLLFGSWGKGRRGGGPVFKQTVAWEQRGRVQVGYYHKVLTCVEYRAVSGVFQNSDPPPPLHPASVSSPRTKGGARGVHTRRAVRGVGSGVGYYNKRKGEWLARGWGNLRGLQKLGSWPVTHVFYSRSVDVDGGIWPFSPNGK